MKSPDPNNFFSKQDITINEAIEAARPVPPWRRKLINDLKGNKNSSPVYVPGVNDQPLPENKQVAKKPNHSSRKWVNIILIPLILIHWLVVLLQNLLDVFSDGIQEIILALENFISKDAQTEPIGPPPSD